MLQTKAEIPYQILDKNQKSIPAQNMLQYACMQKIDFVTLLKEYQSGWVAISADFKKVVFVGKTLKEVREKAKDIREKLYYFPAGEFYGGFIGTQ